jgi:HlyD family secretion protein
MTDIASIPSSFPRGRKLSLWMAVPLLGIIAFASIRYFSSAFSGGTGGPSGAFYSVLPIDMDVKVTKDGELQAVNNTDIECLVEGTTTIQTLIQEGSFVKKGQVMCTLDSSAIKDRIDDTTLDLQKAEAGLTTAKELKEIQESQNGANLQSAQVTLTLAQLDLQEYTDGLYPQDVQNDQTDLEMAKITLKDKQEDLAQTKSLFNKGFVTASDVKTSELALTTATNDVGKATSALSVLTQYTHPKDMATKKNALSQGEQGLKRTQQQNDAQLEQQIANVEANQEAYNTLKRRMEHYQEQLADCTITAPADGMVVYASSGDRYSSNPIQEGAQVHERQDLLRLPDTSSMKAIVRINESAVGQLAEGQRAMVTIANMSHPIGATLSKISVLADNSQRFWNPDLKEYPVDLVLDETPKNMKPGLDVNAQILVSHLNHVMAVPLSTVFSAGSDVYVFVRNGEKVVPTKVTLGSSNDTNVQIKSGLCVGDQVQILEAGQGRDLLEANGIKVEPTTQPSDSFNDPHGNKQHSGKDGGKDSSKDAAKANPKPTASAAPAAPAATPSAAAPQTDKSATAADLSLNHRPAVAPTTMPSAQT